ISWPRWRIFAIVEPDGIEPGAGRVLGVRLAYGSQLVSAPPAAVAGLAGSATPLGWGMDAAGTGPATGAAAEPQPDRASAETAATPTTRRFIGTPQFGAARRSSLPPGRARSAR